MTAWMLADQWERLKAGDGCALCADAHLDENPFSYKVAELPYSFVRLAKNQYLRGWTVVTLKRHANELWELGDDELAGYWKDVARVARALDHVYRPAKMNYGVFGNLCPHVYCHLIPRTYDDDPSKPLNMNERDVRLSPSEYTAILGSLRRELERSPPNGTDS